MGTALQKRLKQTKFTSVYQEALLNVLALADHFTNQSETVCEQFGITSTQYNVLRILRGIYPEGHSRRSIIERMIHQAPDVTRIIDRLVKAELVERAKGCDDGRHSLTYITKKGLRLLQEMDPVMQKTDKKIQKHLTRSEALLLSEFCERLYGSKE